PDGIIDRARRHVIERGKPNHCNECREAGPGRGWPDIEGWWLRSIECREVGSGRGWPAIEGRWLRSNGCREAGPGRGWPDIEGWWLRSIECREAGSGRGWPAIEGRWRRAPQRLLMSANPQMDGRQSPRAARPTRIPPRSAP